MLDKNKILQNINFDIIPTIYIYDEISSTNILAKQIADNVSDFTVVIAKSQTEGYGRFGRSFLSPVGGLYMSVILKGQRYNDTHLTSHTALSVCKALDPIVNCDVNIKWINDILIKNKKVCGISCEQRLNSDGNIAWYIIGIGINILDNFENINLPENIKPDLLDKITCLARHSNIHIDTSLLVSNILNNLYDLPKDNNQMWKEYSERIPFLDKLLQVISKDKTYTAVAKYINNTGKLVVEYNNELVTLDNQEVSILI